MRSRKWLLFVAMLVIVICTCAFAACDKTGSQDGSGNNGGDGNSFTVTFDSLGGTVVKSITVEQGATLTLPDNPIKNGYTFDGWYLDSSCITIFDNSVAISKDITLYAKWVEAGGDDPTPGPTPTPDPTPDPPPTPEPQVYTITFLVDGNTYKTIELTEGTTLTLPTNPTKTCHIFEGWYVDEDFINKFNETQTISSNIPLYAKWTENHTPITDSAVEADCEHTGLSEGSHCDVCGTVLVAQQLVPAAHSYGSWISEVPANCTETGTKGHYECSECHKHFDAEHNAITDLTIAIDENAHDLVPHSGQMPTCTDVGWEAYDTCSHCDYTTYSEIKASGHDYNDNSVCKTCGYALPQLEYTLNADGESYSVTGIGDFSGTELNIPSVYDSKPVTDISSTAFNNCTELTSVTIPDSVKSIGKGAFA